MPLGQTQVPFPDSTSPGTHFQESAGRIINGYVEPLGAGAPSTIIYRRGPGLRNFGTTTQVGFRGAIQVLGVLYCAFTNRLVTLTSAGGAAADVGLLAGTEKGFFARNNKSGTPDIVFVNPEGVQAIVTSSSITSPIDTDLPAPNSVCCIDGFFFFTIGDGRVFASDLNAVTINPLSFATAEAKPDGLIRGIPWAGNLFLFGPSTTEVWNNAGTTPFPFQRVVVIPRGLAGSHCVAGYEDNFSRALIWVADDNTVVRLNGYVPEKISPPDLDGLIEQVTDKRQLEMSVFMSRGHAFIMLSSIKSPTTAPWREWSWVFDLNTNRWAERNSYLRERSRITGGFFAFDKWLCGDRLTGNIQEITNQTYREITDPFRWRLESGAVENFPVGARVGRADFEFVTGVGISAGSDPIETDPVVEISWSDDGGQTYYAPIQRKLGTQAQTRQLVSLIACTGRSSWNARRWRLDIADPVYVGFMAAYQQISPKVSDIG
jgi:hypothetical protein